MCYGLLQQSNMSIMMSLSSTSSRHRSIGSPIETAVKILPSIKECPSSSTGSKANGIEVDETIASTRSSSVNVSSKTSICPLLMSPLKTDSLRSNFLPSMNAENLFLKLLLSKRLYCQKGVKNTGLFILKSSSDVCPWNMLNRKSLAYCSSPLG